MAERKPLVIEDLDLLPGDDVAGTTPKRTRTQRYKPVSKTALREMFATLNGAATVTGHDELALQDIELDNLADTWHDVIKMYPQIGRMVSQGNTLTVWGRALFCTFVIVERRRVALTAPSAGPTRNGVRHDGVGQDHLIRPPIIN